MTRTVVHGGVTFRSDGGRGQWEATVAWAGHTVDVDLNVGDAAAGVLDGVAGFVTDLARFDALARQGMRDDADAIIRDYLDFDGAGELLHAVFGTGDVEPATFLAPLRLVRVGLYPSGTDTRAVFDYTFGRDLTDHVVAVTFDGRGTVTGVAVES